MTPLAQALAMLRECADALEPALAQRARALAADLAPLIRPGPRIVKDWPGDPIAWDREISDGGPHGSIQWKGTNVCMDVRCACGKHGHIDDMFCYFYKCLACGRVYACGSTVRFYECSPEVAAKEGERALIDNTLEEPPALVQGSFVEPEPPDPEVQAGLDFFEKDMTAAVFRVLKGPDK